MSKDTVPPRGASVCPRYPTTTNNTQQRHTTLVCPQPQDARATRTHNQCMSSSRYGGGMSCISIPPPPPSPGLPPPPLPPLSLTSLRPTPRSQWFMYASPSITSGGERGGRRADVGKLGTSGTGSPGEPTMIARGRCLRRVLCLAIAAAAATVAAVLSVDRARRALGVGGGGALLSSRRPAAPSPCRCRPGSRLGLLGVRGMCVKEVVMGPSSSEVYPRRTRPASWG